MLGFLASRREEFDQGPVKRLDRSELLCNKILLKYKRHRESFWHTHQKGAETVPPSQFIARSDIPIQFSSVAQSCPTPMNHSTPGLPVHHQLPEFTQTHVHRVGDANQPSHPLLSPSPPASNPSQHQGLFQWVNSSHEVAQVLELNFSISPSNEYSGLISFRIDWFDLLAFHGTLKSLLQHHNS